MGPSTDWTLRTRPRSVLSSAARSSRSSGSSILVPTGTSSRSQASVRGFRESSSARSELLASTEGTKAADLGHGVRAVREYDDVRLEGRVRFGPWRIESSRSGLVVRTRRPGDRLAGRSKKVQDVLVDAKVPRDQRDDWPLVATEDGAIVAVAGIEEAPGWEGAVRATRGDR